MKKFLTLFVFTFTFSCINPSMENGFAKLIESLKQLTASFEAINVPQIQTDLESMVVDLTLMAEDIDAYNESIVEYNNTIIQYSDAMAEFSDAMLEYEKAIAEYNNAIAEYSEATDNFEALSLQSFANLKEMADNGNQLARILLILAGIHASMDQILVQVQTVVTAEQVQALTQQVSQMSDDIELSIQGSDVDGDGIIHSEDDCPTLAGPESNNGCPI
jgi:chromosome segregation ATPase